VSRRAKILLSSLALLVVGSAVFYFWMMWSTTNPLRLRVVDVQRDADGSSVVSLEVTNASLFPVKYMGAVSTYAQPLHDPLASSPVRVGLANFPERDVGPKVLAPKAILAGTIRTSPAVSCELQYQWELAMMEDVRPWGEKLKGWLPRKLGGLIPRLWDVRMGDTGEILLPLTPLPAQGP
jgi:hypothetical protein